MFAQLKPAILITLVLTVLTGIIYPLAITGIAQIIFPSRSHGSLIVRGGRVVGSELIGQNFTKPGYFYGRPSAAGAGYDAAASGGSNLGPTSKVLIARIDSMTRALHAQNPSMPVPIELVTTSGSGLDPHISPAAAEFQIPRVARERGISEQTVSALVARHTEGRDLGFLGEPRINVLQINMELEGKQ